jgi:hypothetical protein
MIRIRRPRRLNREITVRNRHATGRCRERRVVDQALHDCDEVGYSAVTLYFASIFSATPGSKETHRQVGAADVEYSEHGQHGRHMNIGNGDHMRSSRQPVAMPAQRDAVTYCG